MSNPDSFPLPTKPLTRVNLGQSVVGVKRSYTEKPPLNHFNPDPWLRASRTTPGMTYRTNEDRTPANPGPGQYQSYNHEMQDSHVVNNTPGVFRRQNYLTGAAVAGGALLLIFFSLWY